jgi:branched-chain amino acid transport system substrate-binding protein
MNKTTKTILWLIILIIIIVGVWYGVSKKPIAPTTKEPIKIGAILPLTGIASSLGEIMREGLEWKIEELKKDGVPIELYIEDFQSDPKQAVSAFYRLVNEKGLKIIFSITSAAGMALKPLAEENKVLLWVDNAHPDQTKNSNYILRHSNIAENDAIILGNFIKQKGGYKKIGFIYTQEEWGVSWNQHFSNFVKKELNAEIISEAIDPKQSDFRTTLTKVINKKPDAVVLVAFGPAAGLLIKQLKELNYTGDLYSSNGFVLTPDAIKIAGDAAKGMYYLAYEENVQFKQDYKSKFNKEPSIVGFIGYTDIELLYYAIQQAKSTDPEKIIKFIKSLNEFQGKYEKIKINPTGDILIFTKVKVWE